MVMHAYEKNFVVRGEIHFEDLYASGTILMTSDYRDTLLLTNKNGDRELEKGVKNYISIIVFYLKSLEDGCNNNRDRETKN